MHAIDHFTEPYGTMIHPSVFCILDRFPRFNEQSQFKALKKDMSDYRDRSTKDSNNLPPWLEGMQLQASGVKAFRILVCGKTGVGKSTLINKVFGVEMVWATSKQKTFVLSSNGRRRLENLRATNKASTTSTKHSNHPTIRAC